MKKTILSVLAFSSFIFSCTNSITVNPSSPSPSTSASTSTTDPSIMPSSSVSSTPITSASPVVSATPSASTSSKPKECSNATFTVGQQVSGTEFFAISCPQVKIGTKWTYSTVGADISVEITGLSNGVYTVKTIVAGKESITSTSNPTGSTIDSNITVTYEGTESVTVPSGTYVAYKASYTTTQNGIQSKNIFWMDKNVGTVKVKSEISGFTFDTVLKEFIN